MHDYNKREKIEWLNYWIEDANTNSKKRIILLGDSVTRELRKQLDFFLHEEYAVDVLAMSYSVFDDMILEEIKHFFQSSGYQYDYIFYQMGVHHGHHIKCVESALDAGRFASKSEEILSILLRYASSVIALPSTLESDVYEGERKVSCEYRKEIEKRNEILETAAKRLKISFYNLNEKIDYERVRFTDRFHFYGKEYESIAKVIAADFFPDVCCASSNQIETMQELEKRLEKYRNKKIYVYGNGVRGIRIRRYLQMQKYRFDGFVVSDGYEMSNEETIGISQVKMEGALFIVTPVDPTVWRRLEANQADYISLHPDIHTFLRMYISMIE